MLSVATRRSGSEAGTARPSRGQPRRARACSPARRRRRCDGHVAAGGSATARSAAVRGLCCEGRTARLIRRGGADSGSQQHGSPLGSGVPGPGPMAQGVRDVGGSMAATDSAENMMGIIVASSCALRPHVVPRGTQSKSGHAPRTTRRPGPRALSSRGEPIVSTTTTRCGRAACADDSAC